MDFASKVVSSGQAGRQAAGSPALLLHHKTNHPAADAGVIIHARSCRKYLPLQPELQRKGVVGGRKQSGLRKERKNMGTVAPLMGSKSS